MALVDTALPSAKSPSPPSPPGPPDGWKPRRRRWEASLYLRTVHGLEVAPATLAKLASIGGGPAFHKVGRVPVYPVEELDAWALKRLGRLQRSTSDVEPDPEA